MKRFQFYTCLCIILFFVGIKTNCQNQALVTVCSYMKVNKAYTVDFGKDTNQVLLCVLIKGPGKGSYNRNIIRHVQNEYHGKYLFIKGEEYPKLINYSDTSIYRFVFYHDNYVSSNASNTAIYSSSFGIWDRSTNNKYTPGKITSNYGMYVKGYMMTLENLRNIHANKL